MKCFENMKWSKILSIYNISKMIIFIFCDRNFVYFCSLVLFFYKNHYERGGCHSSYHQPIHYDSSNICIYYSNQSNMNSFGLWLVFYEQKISVTHSNNRKRMKRGWPAHVNLTLLTFPQHTTHHPCNNARWDDLSYWKCNFCGQLQRSVRQSTTLKFLGKFWK